MGAIKRNKASILRLSLIGLLTSAVVLLAALRGAAAYRERTDDPPAATRWIPTALGAVAVQASGPPGGRPVLLVGGTAGWSGFWSDVAQHLAGHGYRVIAVDLPPFGFSAHDPLRRYNRVNQAERLSAVLKAMAPNAPAIAVGHSYGAGPVLEAALRHPSQMRQLVLVDAALGAFDAAPRPANWGLRQSPLAELAVATGFTNPWALRPMLRSLLARKQAGDRWAETLRRPMRRPGTTPAYAAWLPELFNTDDGAASRRSATVAAMRTPVSLIWGEADQVTPISQGETLSHLTRATHFIRLPGVGHIPHIEDPDHFLAALDTAIEGQP